MTNSQTNEEFEIPTESTTNQYQMQSEFEEAAVPENVNTEEAAMPVPSADQYSGVDENLVQIKTQIESQLSRLVGVSSSQALFAPQGANNIVGVGLGVPDEPSSLGLTPGATAINVYVVEQTSVDEIKSVLVDSMGISAAASDNVPINVVVSGIIDAQPHRFCMRPAPGGVSVGHFKITAGTLGCLAYRPNRLLILSNNHVLANTNNASFGDHIYQPGPYDGGKNACSPNPIAILERYVPIYFDGRCNYVDAATGWAWPDRVRRELVYLSGGKPELFRISSLIRDPQLNMIVGKSGRTTQLTRGQITDINASVRVNYGSGRVALFCDQIIIRGLGGDFSAGGDSGSSIWTWDNQRNPVGLLFAGGGGLTIANKMRTVLRALDVKLYT